MARSASSTAKDRLQELRRIIGTWKVSGEARGTASYDWFDSKNAIIQRVSLGDTKGIEFIRYDSTTKALQSYYFDRSGSQVLTYRYSIKGDEFRIELFRHVADLIFLHGVSSRDLSVPASFLAAWCCQPLPGTAASSSFV